MAEKRDYYEVLGLKKGASEDEIKKAILTISSKYDIYSQGSRKYYDSVNVVEIVKHIFNNVD